MMIDNLDDGEVINLAKELVERKESLIRNFIRSTLCSNKTTDIVVCPTVSF